MRIAGERLSKSNARLLQDAREAHLTDDQRNLLTKARREAAEANLALSKAQRTYNQAVEESGLHAAQAANQRLNAAKEAAQSAGVRLSVCEKGFGLRD